jgi:hypothetical protein
MSGSGTGSTCRGGGCTGVGASAMTGVLSGVYAWTTVAPAACY